MRPEDAPEPDRIEQPLLRHLRTALSMPELEYEERPTRIAVGAESAIYGFQLRGSAGAPTRELVCRLLPPDGEFAQIQKEAVAQRALKELGIRVPEVVCLGDGESGLGGPFLVMQRIRGCGGDAWSCWFAFLSARASSRLHARPCAPRSSPRRALACPASTCKPAERAGS